MREHMRAELTMAALTMAVQRRRPGAGLIDHSDRGSQYAAGDYRKILQAAAITQSISRKGNWMTLPVCGAARMRYDTYRLTLRTSKSE